MHQGDNVMHKLWVQYDPAGNVFPYKRKPVVDMGLMVLHINETTGYVKGKIISPPKTAAIADVPQQPIEELTN